MTNKQKKNSKSQNSKNKLYYSNIYLMNPFNKITYLTKC